MPLKSTDKAKFNELYLSISKIKIPEFNNDEAIDMGIKVQEGLQIILKAIKEVSQIIK